MLLAFPKGYSQLGDTLQGGRGVNALNSTLLSPLPAGAPHWLSPSSSGRVEEPIDAVHTDWSSQGQDNRRSVEGGSGSQWKDGSCSLRGWRILHMVP